MLDNPRGHLAELLLDARRTLRFGRLRPAAEAEVKRDHVPHDLRAKYRLATLSHIPAG